MSFSASVDKRKSSVYPDICPYEIVIFVLRARLEYENVS